MFCSNCGAKIIGYGKFCTQCGAEVPLDVVAYQQEVAAPVAQPAAVQPSEVQGVIAPKSSKPLVDLRQSFRKGWRGVSGSVVYLLAAVFFTIAQLVKIINIETFTEDLWETLAIMFAVIFENTFDWGVCLEVLPVLVVLPGVLVTAGIWVLYVDSLRNEKLSVMPAGLRLLQVGLGATLFVYLLLETVMAALIFNLLGTTLGQGYAESLGEFLMNMLLCFTVLEAGIAIYLKAISVSIKATEECAPRGKKILFACGILALISGVLMIIGTLSESVDITELCAGLENTLFVWTAAAGNILLGVTLIMLQRFMEKEEDVRMRHYTSRYHAEKQEE